MPSKISIVVPTYNEEKYLRPCLESVAPQKHLADECIALDNSTDSTPELCKSFGWTVITQTGKGVSNARKEGFDATKGDIIASTDADTAVSEKWVQTIEKAFQDPKVVCVFGPVYLLDGPLWLKLIANIGFTLFLWIGVLTGKPNVSGMNFAVRKSAYLKIGGFREELTTAEDVDLGLRMQKIGKVKYVHALYVHTSARRLLNYGIAKFIWHHFRNYLRIIFLGKASSDFNPIR
jgi:glycosyltransferase involved in cell wall biosynthesis